MTFLSHLISLKIVVPSYVHFIAKDRIMYFFLFESYSILCKYHIFYVFITWWTSGWFQILVIVICVAVNIAGELSLQYADFISFGHIRKSGMAGSYSRLVLWLLRNLHTAFHNGSVCLHFHQHVVRVPFSLLPYQNLLFFDLWKITILTGVRWNCFSLMASDLEHLSCVFWPLEKCLFMPFSISW